MRIPSIGGGAPWRSATSAVHARAQRHGQDVSQIRISVTRASGKRGTTSGGEVPRRKPLLHGGARRRGGLLDRPLDVVIDARLAQPAAGAAFVDGDARLGRQVVPAPSDGIELEG